MRKRELQKRQLTHAEFIQELRRQIAEAGNQKTFAERMGISSAWLSDILADRRDPGKKLLAAVGYKKNVTYERTA